MPHRNSSTLLLLCYCGSVLTTNYLEIECFVPITGLQFALKGSLRLADIYFCQKQFLDEV